MAFHTRNLHMDELPGLDARSDFGRAQRHEVKPRAHLVVIEHGRCDIYHHLAFPLWQVLQRDDVEPRLADRLHARDKLPARPASVVQ